MAQSQAHEYSTWPKNMSESSPDILCTRAGHAKLDCVFATSNACILILAKWHVADVTPMFAWQRNKKGSTAGYGIKPGYMSV